MFKVSKVPSSALRLIALIAASFLSTMTAACVRVSSAPMVAVPMAPVVEDSVDVFVARVPAPYVQVAELRVHRFFASDKKVLASLKREAAQLGANGVLLVNASNDVQPFERAIAVRWASTDP